MAMISAWTLVYFWCFVEVRFNGN